MPWLIVPIVVPWLPTVASPKLTVSENGCPSVAPRQKGTGSRNG